MIRPLRRGFGQIRMIVCEGGMLKPNVGACSVQLPGRDNVKFLKYDCKRTANSSTTISRCLLTCNLKVWRRIQVHASKVREYDDGFSKRCRLASSTPSESHQTNGPVPLMKVKALYDGACPLCMAEIRLLMKKNKKKQSVDFVDISRADYRAEDHGGISYTQAMSEMHVIGTDGKAYRRVEAFQQLYSAVGLGWIVSFTRIPGVYGLLDKLYRWFARNRLKWTKRESECPDGHCEAKIKHKYGK